MILLRALVATAILAVLATAVLTVAAGEVTVRLRLRSIEAARHALDAAQHALVAAAPSLPAGRTSCAQAAPEGGCLLAITTHYAVLPAAPGDARTLQSVDSLVESRLAVRIDAVASGARGDVLARRARLVTLRRLPHPPYAAIVSARDLSDDIQIAGDSLGDDGGSAANALTRDVVHVVYRNARTGAIVPADVWRNTGGTNAPASPWSP